MTMPNGFAVKCDDCTVTISYAGTEAKLACGCSRFGLSVDLTPDAARWLAQELIERAQDCEDAETHELEQMP